MSSASDPEMLGPAEKIRYAEQLIRAEHRVLDDDWLFWGKLADHLNFISHVPEKTGQRASDWREFNRAQDMATGYIRMSARNGQVRVKHGPDCGCTPCKAEPSYEARRAVDD